MLALLLGLVDPITRVAKLITDSRIAEQNATTEHERIAAQERTKTLEAKRDVLVAEAGGRVNAYVRASLALPVVVLLWKVFVYDKAFGQWTGGRTDALDANLWNVVMAVIGFYFLYEGALGVARIMKR